MTARHGAAFLTADERKAFTAAVHAGDSGEPDTRRANALLLLDRGEPVRFVADVLFLDPDTVAEWRRAFRGVAHADDETRARIETEESEDETAVLERARAAASDSRSLFMFVISVAHLFMLSLMLPHPGFAIDAGDAVLGVPGFVECFCTVWAIVILDALLSLRKASGRLRQIVPRILLVCALPPCRATICPSAPGAAIWLPRGGWRLTGEALSRTLERRAAVPMLTVTLLVLPVVLVEFFLKDRIAGMPAVGPALHVANAVIWFCFALEFMMMLSVTARRRQYCVKNWISIVIILFPTFGFLRKMKIFSLLGMMVSTQMRKYRLRGLGVRLTRIALFLNLVERFLRRNPEKFLERLHEKRREKLDELEKLEGEIRRTRDTLSASNRVGAPRLS